MYSEILLCIFKEKGIEEGDRIKLTKGSSSFEGMLLPKIGFGDPTCVILKLDNGYNIGVEAISGIQIELVSKKAKKDEEKIHVGRMQGILPKSRISLLGCGGTIASKIEYETGAVKPAISASELVSTFPELAYAAQIDAKQLFSLSSEDMTPEHWSIMAKEAHDAIKAGADGVVLTHGTDTMHYSAAALSFMLRDLSVPVVFTGSQRSSDRGSSDNKMNLFCSFLCAKSDIAQVGICMHATPNDDFCYFHSGVRARKMHTSRRDAFQTIGAQPLALIDYEKETVTPLCENYPKKDRKRQTVLENAVNSNVALIYIHPGIKGELFSSLSKYDGVVVAGTGLGHISSGADGTDKMTKPVIENVKALCDSGIPVVMAPQTIWGRIDMNVYTTGRKLMEAGVIGNGCDWTPETALVKLMWVLGKEKDKKKAKGLMETNIAGEITQRSDLL
ncbi:glutamyl-tRNA(Gln) amidotransferase subunit D [Candidatus Micrarchaeota archaeon CG1_02_47_40]|nr:MAG: glutamyl-tRNA(Gln) amidotransferase subunit D [Candidatus Micrarchaeota archaeon CG1_02_47_40]